jgi:hypothetical protein
MALREKRLEPLSQRLGRLFDSLVARRWVKRQRVFLAETGGLRLKRIEMADPSRARVKEALLGSLAGTGILPRPVARHHGNLWVEFLEGQPVGIDDPDLPARFAELLAALYGNGPKLIATPDHLSPAAIASDLDILTRAAVLTQAETSKIVARLGEHSPTALWIGVDHTDLLLKNMLRQADGRLSLIDVESVVDDEAIGTGFVKASHRWMGSRRDECLAAVTGNSSIPHFYDYLPYLELRFLAAWTKRSLLLGKDKLVRPDGFRQWLDRHGQPNR